MFSFIDIRNELKKFIVAEYQTRFARITKVTKNPIKFQTRRNFEIDYLLFIFQENMK